MCIICLLFLDNNIEKSRAATGKGNNINKKRLNAKQCIIHRPVVHQACVCVRVLLFVCSEEQSSPARLRAGTRERVRAREQQMQLIAANLSAVALENSSSEGGLKYCQEPYRWTKGHQEGCLLLWNPHDSRVINFSHFQLKAELEVKRSNCHHYSCLIAFCFQ